LNGEGGGRRSLFMVRAKRMRAETKWKEQLNYGKRIERKNRSRNGSQWSGRKP